MPNPYAYLITDTVNDKVAIGVLDTEIKDSTITTALNGVSTGLLAYPAKVVIDFTGDLSGGDKTTLDGLIAAHEGVKAEKREFHSSTSIVNGGEQSITETSTWQDLNGGAVMSVGFFIKDASKAVGIVQGRIKSVGTSGELRIVKGDGTSLMTTPFAVPDSGGAWQNFQFETDIDPPLTLEDYGLEGRLNTATSIAIKHGTLSLLENK